MKHSRFFWLLIPVVIMTVLLSSTSVSVFSSTLENNTVLQQAQRSLDANQKQIATVTPDPIPKSAVQWIHGTSMMKGVGFTWVIITSDNEVSVNLRWDYSKGDGTTPPVSVAATALTKNAEGNPVTMKGSAVLNAGWESPYTLAIKMNGASSLYALTSSLNVVASPLGSSASPSPSLPSTVSETNDNKITSSTVKPQEGVLTVLSSNSFIDSIGNLHLVGEIENGTPEPATYVKATATFYDKNNNVVATDFGYTSPTDLGPRDKAPFEIIVTSASIPVNQIDHYGIIASSQ